jgi:MOSC domain-containing protein YiiM
VGTIEAVCVSLERGVSKSAVAEIELRADHGIVGDGHAGPGIRQVSLLARESIETMREALPDLADGAFAENVITAGITLRDLALGDRLLLGADVVLEVTQIGKTCHDACAIGQAVGECIMPREGIFCRVVEGGRLTAGDDVRLTRRDCDAAESSASGDEK